LNKLSNHKPDEYKIVVLDNGAFHKAKKLIIPENITLVFLPPYSPELYPAEKCGRNTKGSSQIYCLTHLINCKNSCTN